MICRRVVFPKVLLKICPRLEIEFGRITAHFEKPPLESGQSFFGAWRTRTVELEFSGVAPVL